MARNSRKSDSRRLSRVHGPRTFAIGARHPLFARLISRRFVRRPRRRPPSDVRQRKLISARRAGRYGFSGRVSPGPDRPPTGENPFVAIGMEVIEIRSPDWIRNEGTGYRVLWLRRNGGNDWEPRAKVIRFCCFEHIG